jgi:hypothetical protein
MEEGGFNFYYLPRNVSFPQNPCFCPQKNSTWPQTKKKEISEKNVNLTRTGIKSQLTYLENASFLSISYLSSSHKAQSKEHMQKRKHFLLYL